MHWVSIVFQCGIARPKVFTNLEVSRRELEGRRAGVGYSEAAMEISLGDFAPRAWLASSKIASANPNQEVVPDAVRL